MYETNPNTQFPPNPTQHTPEPQNVTNSAPSAVSWEAVEDVALMSAWVFISGDPIVGTNQKGDSLWEAVYKMYEKSRKENPGKLSKRTVESMRARWSRLNKNATKWIGCYKEAYSQKTSGMSMGDVDTIAHQLYNKKTGFPHTLVFEKVMRHTPKWELSYGGGTRRPHPDATESDEEGHGSSKKSRTDEDDGPSDTPVSGASTISRPTGRNAAKAKRKGKGVSSSSSNVVIPEEFTNELRAMRITREKELEVRIKLEQKKLNANLLNVLLAKPNLTTQEEAIKNRLLAEFFN